MRRMKEMNTDRSFIFQGRRVLTVYGLRHRTGKNVSPAKIVSQLVPVIAILGGIIGLPALK